MRKKQITELSEELLKGISSSINRIQYVSEAKKDDEDPCWKGYEMIGMKKNKDGKEVPNCVPKEEVKEEELKEMCDKCHAEPCECDDDDDEEEMEEALDPVNKKAVKKDFTDRKDKDIDNDGDVDSSDEYLHKRRKAISKALAKEEALDEKMTDAQKKTAKSLMRLGDKPRQAVKTAKGQKEKDKEFYRKAYEEVEQVEEAYTPSMGFKGAEEKIVALTKILNLKSNLLKGLEKGTGENFKPEFKEMSKHIEAIYDLWQDIKYQMSMAMPEEVEYQAENVEEAYKTPSEAKAYEAGKKAWRDKKKFDTNPNKKGTPEHTAWSRGHNDVRAKFIKKYGSNEEKMRYESVELGEARKNQADELYFDTYSAAVQYAKAKAEKMGYAVDEDDWHNQITTGPGKPGRGKTVRHTIALKKNGKETRKGLAIQVYNRDTDKKTYELNSYVS